MGIPLPLSPQPQPALGMSSIDQFMRNLVSRRPGNETDIAEIDIVCDNAKLPSDVLRVATLKPVTRRAIRYSSNAHLQAASKGRQVGRYHSEPLDISRAAKSLQAPKVSSRWESHSSTDYKDEMLVPPQRCNDRWGVSRVNSDSVLLSIMPKRSHVEKEAPKEVSKNVLSSLQRKYSATQVIATMRTATRSNSDADEDSSSIIEQLINVPGEIGRRKQLGKERFINSILGGSDAPHAPTEVGQPTTLGRVCSAFQSTMTMGVLVWQIILVELLVPVGLSAYRLVHSMMAPSVASSLPSPDEGVEPLINLIGANSFQLHVGGSPRVDESTIRKRKENQTMSTGV
eukprot:Nitzschia sp. Nitz4//scaffold1_size375055//21289//22317//NITZ4_000210-RA/size375055-processed-gene-0.296-mRNA-1//1//CDS//3329540847//9137//frame0